MKVTSRLILIVSALSVLSCTSELSDLHIVSTGDLHGAYFPDPYVGNGTKPSLMSVKHYLDSLRGAVGDKNVMLVDAGDFMQGDNAAYYFNYVSGSPHIFPRIAEYVGYDVVVGGNHDIETGHAVYDRVVSELKKKGIPFLSGNAFTDSGKLYFRDHVLLKKGGHKVLVLGFNNANIASWLSEEVWSGMKFKSLVPLVDERVSSLSKKYKPDAVVVVVHSGTGTGDGSMLESQGLDIFKTIKGVDLLVTAHDHKPYVCVTDSIVLMNSGARAGHVGHAVISGDKVSAEIIRLDKNEIDGDMKTMFQADFDSVRSFTMQKVGEIEREMKTRDAYMGMCDYMNLLHTVQLSVPDVQISFSAPLTYNGTVKSGTAIYNDMFTIYPFENQLFVVKLKGDEVRSYLEKSYDNWIEVKDGHVLKISMKDDPHTTTSRWTFGTRPYNLDSAAGLNYTVDVTAEQGSRIKISSMADGSPFDSEAWYNVAMTSYRANGGGGLLEDGAGLSPDIMKDRVVARYQEIRVLIYEYIRAHGAISPELISSPLVIGRWNFTPEKDIQKTLEKDMELLFPVSK